MYASWVPKRFDMDAVPLDSTFAAGREEGFVGMTGKRKRKGGW